jgi:hypothetical protein
MPSAIALSSSGGLALREDNITVCKKGGVVNGPGIGTWTSLQTMEPNWGVGVKLRHKPLCRMVEIKIYRLLGFRFLQQRFMSLSLQKRLVQEKRASQWV